MKAIRSVVIVLTLLAGACGSSNDDGARITSSDAQPTESADGGAVSTGDGAMESETSAPDTTDSTLGATSTVDATTPESGDQSGDGGADGDPARTGTDSVGTALLARTSDATAAASSGRFEGRLAMASAPGVEGGGSFEITLAGAYDVEAEATEINIDLSGLSSVMTEGASAEEAQLFASMFAEPVQLRTIGDTAWVRWSLLTTMFGAAPAGGSGSWIEAEVDEAASMTDQFGVDSPDSPTDLLAALQDLDASVEEVGRESVRGVETTHYRVIIDLESAAENLPAAERAELEAELPGGITGQLPMDLWLDDDDLMRRLLVEITDFESMGFGDDGGEIASMVVDFEIFDVGQPVLIEPPPADQVITADELGFDLGQGF